MANADVKPEIPELKKPAAAPVAATPEVDAAVGADSKAEPVKAVYRIDGKIEPGVMFRPATIKQRKELFALEAVVELDESDRALFDKIEASAKTDEFG
ncbi:hypothetical protein U1872_06495 [Sphingomonas sp. RB3P16]|uniref:hypothetical protein n=1 Tax=Parasphingomonas frigoris TaxID=3096163 RepID=UPI002FCA1CE5